MNEHMAYGITIEDWTKARLRRFYIDRGNSPESSERQAERDIDQLKSYWQSQQRAESTTAMPTAYAASYKNH